MRSVCGLLLLSMLLLGGCGSFASPSGLDAGAVADRAPYASGEERDWERYFGRYRVDLQPEVVAVVIERAIEGLEEADAISARLDEMGIGTGIRMDPVWGLDVRAPHVGFMLPLNHRAHFWIMRDVRGWVILDPNPGETRVLTENILTGP